MSHPLMAADQPLLLTVMEAARRLGIGRSLLYRLLEVGEIPSLTLGRCRRIRPEDLRAYIDRRAIESIDSTGGY